VLTKDLLRVSRAGGGYRPQFAGPGAESLARRVLDAYREHVGTEQAALDATLDDIEHDADDFKLVRGLAKLCERAATFETTAPVDPERARRVAFEAAESVGVVTADERERALGQAADRLGVGSDALADALYADREARQVLAAFDPPWDAAGLVDRYNLSLAQTALFDAVEVRVRSSDPRGLVRAVKRLGLLYEVRREGTGRVVELTGPDALFRRTRRYGTRFARLLRTVARAGEWRLEATVDDRGRERTLELSHDDVPVPGDDPVDVEYDSGVERRFAARFEALDSDWTLVREPDVLDAGDRLMIPDFAFDYRHADFRVFFEVMGFWTPAYVEKKLAQVEALDGVDFLVAADASLGVGEELAARDARVVEYDGDVPVKPVRDALREHEDRLVAESAAALPDELVPEDDAVAVEAVATRHGVSADALDGVAFPEHAAVGRTLVRPAVLADLDAVLAPGMDYADAEAAVTERGIDDTSAALARLGYRVEWDGLGAGTLRERD
jgi:predicted nuclease of restriction endonuclease-like RecB superfamily